MSKKHINLSETVMSRIEREHITMKPKWYFVVGSLSLLVGLVGLSIISIFLVTISMFSLRTHGPMGEIRYQALLASFPWWAPVLAIVGLGCGVWLLKKYDFSYKKNFLLVIMGFVTAIIVSGILLDYLGLNTVLSRQGQMRRLYQQIDGKRAVPLRGQGQNKINSVTPSINIRE